MFSVAGKVTRGEWSRKGGKREGFFFFFFPSADLSVLSCRMLILRNDHSNASILSSQRAHTAGEVMHDTHVGKNI